MLEQLKVMEVGERFEKMIQAIYTRQKTNIRINGDFTKEVEIEKGTRQECPLSPLLFILSLEILNNLEKTEIQEEPA